MSPNTIVRMGSLPRSVRKILCVRRTETVQNERRVHCAANLPLLTVLTLMLCVVVLSALVLHSSLRRCLGVSGLSPD